MRKPPPILVLAAVFSGGALLLPLSKVVRSGGNFLIRSAWVEAVSLSTYGKWWVNAPHRWLVDAFSGDFPAFYNPLSDALNNLIAKVSGLVPMTSQVLIYAPLLSLLFVWFAYDSVYRVFKNRKTAWISTAIVALGGSSQLGLLVSRDLNTYHNELLHVPAQTLYLAVAQCLGWTLFLPCLAWTHLAYRQNSWKATLLFGALFGLLFHAHTLTFISAGMSVLVYLTLSEFDSLSPGRKRNLWLTLLAALAAAFLWQATRPHPFSFLLLAVFWSTAVALLFLFSSKKRFYLLGFGTSALLALPYALGVLARSTPSAGEGGTPAVRFAWLILFYFPYLLGAALAWTRARGRILRDPALLWGTSIFLANLFLSYNYIWRWGNHPYRFVIQLIFPLAILAAYGLADAKNLLSRLLLGWIGLVVLYNAGCLAFGPRINVNYTVSPPAETRLLERLRKESSALAPQARILAPPEFDYPKGSVQAAVLLNFSAVPSYFPDYRYQQNPERYKNRMALFCFLFPDYPHIDVHTRFQACLEDLEPHAFRILEPKLRSGVIPLYSLGLAASLGEPFAGSLKRATARFAWTPLVQEDGNLLVSLRQTETDGTARFGEGRSLSESLVSPFTIEKEGSYRWILAARGLEKNFAGIRIDDGPEALPKAQGNWLDFTTPLRPGSHRITIRWKPDQAASAIESVYFISAIHEADFSRLVRP